MSEPVRFDQWMDRRLYGPDGFYEIGGQAGRRGDFITSPEVGPLFGVLVGRALDRWWDALGQPDPYVVVDAGAGRGALAITVLRTELRCRAALRYTTVERSAALRALQAEVVPSSVEIRADLPEVVSVVLANELLDNLAFRLLERTGNGWQEVWVDDDGPVLRPVEVVPTPISEVECAPGARLPWFEGAARWVRAALNVADVVTCVDYGVEHTGSLVGRPWLRTYRHHGIGDDPFGADGPTDVTADVAFDQFPHGATVRTQASWLASLDIGGLVEAGDAAWVLAAAAPNLAAFEMRSRRSEADALLDPSGLGAFLVVTWSSA